MLVQIWRGGGLSSIINPIIRNDIKLANIVYDGSNKEVYKKIQIPEDLKMIRMDRDILIIGVYGHIEGGTNNGVKKYFYDRTTRKVQINDNKLSIDLRGIRAHSPSVNYEGKVLFYYIAIPVYIDVQYRVYENNPRINGTYYDNVFLLSKKINIDLYINNAAVISCQLTDFNQYNNFIFPEGKTWNGSNIIYPYYRAPQMDDSRTVGTYPRFDQFSGNNSSYYSTSGNSTFTEKLYCNKKCYYNNSVRYLEIYLTKGTNNSSINTLDIKKIYFTDL